MTVTISEIARRAGVSTATVSRVFSNKGYVKQATRDEVLELARELNYTPKPYKTKPVCSEFSNIIGVVIPDICNTYYMEVIHGIESVVDPQGIEVLIANTDEDPNKEIRSLTMFRQSRIGGLIAVPVSDAVEYNTAFLVEMNSSDIPVVLLDRDLRASNMDGVFMNNFDSAYQSTQAFIKNGHRDIAIICGPTTSTSGLDRLNGYLEALKAHHIPIREEYILYGDFMQSCAYELTKKLVDKQKAVTAIFASNSRMSMGCLLALAEKHLAIPDDMAFIACGKLDILNNSISSVIYPTMSIGAECARILLEKMQSGKRQRSTPKKRITFDMELVLRGSEAFPKNRKAKR